MRCAAGGCQLVELAAAGYEAGKAIPQPRVPQQLNSLGSWKVVYEGSGHRHQALHVFLATMLATICRRAGMARQPHAEDPGVPPRSESALLSGARCTGAWL